jgi:hypothetical protein
MLSRPLNQAVFLAGRAIRRGRGRHPLLRSVAESVTVPYGMPSPTSI